MSTEYNRVHIQPLEFQKDVITKRKDVITNSFKKMECLESLVGIAVARRDQPARPLPVVDSCRAHLEVCASLGRRAQARVCGGPRDATYV